MMKLTSLCLFIVLSTFSRCSFPSKYRKIDPNLIGTALTYSGQYKTVEGIYSDILLSGGGELETELIDQCFRGSVTTQAIDEFLEKGGKLNAWVDYTHVYERRRWGADIPIIKWFVSDKTVTEEDDYRINVFSALLYSEISNKKKLDLSVYMLARGANPWVRIPGERDSLSAIEYLFLDLRGDVPSKYTIDLVDTLIAYGAKPSEVNLETLGKNFAWINRMLKVGADPRTLNLDILLDDVDLMDTNFAAILAYKPDYRGMDTYMFMATNYKPELILEIMIKNGFDVNMEIHEDSYMIDAAIRFDKLEAVKVLVDHGADRCRGNVNPYQYVQGEPGGTSEEIVEYLKAKFK